MELPRNNFIFDDYDFYSNCDSMGGDFLYVEKKTIPELKAIADLIPSCIAFNTYGWLKISVRDRSNFVPLGNKFYQSDGIYIKKSFRPLGNTKYKNICINLERRKDRKENMVKEFKKCGIADYEFFPAVDGKTLQPNNPLLYLFRGNDFHSRKAIIGCAMSHYLIWQKLIRDPEYDSYMVYEDDIIFTENIESIRKVLSAIPYDTDILFFGLTSNNKFMRPTENGIAKVCIWHYQGGAFAYLITKQAATKLILYIAEHNIKRAIDWVIFSANLNLYVTVPQLVVTPTSPNNPNYSSDISTNGDIMDEI